MIVTRHAKRRMKQRCGVGKKSADRMAEVVYEKGLKHSDLSGNLKKWVDSLYFRNKTANQIRLYGDKAYIFHNTKLITVIPIPDNLMQKVNRLREQVKDGQIKSR